METSVLSKAPTAALSNWNDPKVLAQIKESYGKTLNEQEWQLFLGLGKATGLNPFLREIWAVKYGNQSASIFIGRDGYRRSAQNHPEYEYHFTDAVYSNDAYKVVNGEVSHEYNLKDRGTLVGAYCVVKRKNASRPAITYVELREYVQKFGVWTTKPATMIKKVSEAQGLRASFQELFAGTYEESEQWQEEKPTTRIVNATHAEKEVVRKAVNKATESNMVDAQVVEAKTPNSEAKEEAIDVTPVEQPAAEAAAPAVPYKISVEQTRKLYALWAEYKAASKMPEEESSSRRKQLLMEMFGVNVSTSLTVDQGNELIKKIEEMIWEASQ